MEKFKNIISRIKNKLKWVKSNRKYNKLEQLKADVDIKENPISSQMSLNMVEYSQVFDKIYAHFHKIKKSAKITKPDIKPDVNEIENNKPNPESANININSYKEFTPQVITQLIHALLKPFELYSQILPNFNNNNNNDNTDLNKSEKTSFDNTIASITRQINKTLRQIEPPTAETVDKLSKMLTQHIAVSVLLPIFNKNLEYIQSHIELIVMMVLLEQDEIYSEYVLNEERRQSATQKYTNRNKMEERTKTLYEQSRNIFSGFLYRTLSVDDSALMTSQSELD
jgi:hypothetical protein